jgi:hypothetical protein
MLLDGRGQLQVIYPQCTQPSVDERSRSGEIFVYERLRKHSINFSIFLIYSIFAYLSAPLIGFQMMHRQALAARQADGLAVARRTPRQIERLRLPCKVFHTRFSHNALQTETGRRGTDGMQCHGLENRSLRMQHSRRSLCREAPCILSAGCAELFSPSAAVAMSSSAPTG